MKRKKIVLTLMAILLVGIVLYLCLPVENIKTWIATQSNQRANVGASKTFDISATSEDHVTAKVTCTDRNGSTDYFSIEITGTGNMKDWTSWGNTDYSSYIDNQGGWFWVINQITIGSGVTNIGNYAFACSDVYEASVTISDTVTSIGDYAFAGSGISGNITIPSSVISIGDYAFDGSWISGNITIPSSVTSIGDYAFRRCKKLTGIIVDSNNLNYSNDAGDGVLFNKDKSTLICYPAGKTDTTYQVSYLVTSIEACGFYGNTYIKKISVPSNIEEIKDYTFYGCSNLNGFCGIIEESDELNLKIIGNYAFYNCKKLVDFTNMNYVTNIGNYAFYNCSALLNDRTEIGNTVIKSVGDYAFYNCGRLEVSMIDANSLKTIGNYAYSKSGITEAYIKNNVTSIGKYAFLNCSKLPAINVVSTNTNYCSEDGVLFNKNKSTLICYPAGKTDSTYIVPTKVTLIENYAFSYNDNIQTLTIDSKVNEIKDQGIYNNSKLNIIKFCSTPSTIGDISVNSRNKAYYSRIFI